jgi:hypothetical protein
MSYVNTRASFEDLQLPKSPEELLRLIIEDSVFIDNNIMPLVLSMAKTHVESINTITTLIKQP